MPYPSGPREWMPGPKNWTTFEIDSDGHVFLDGKEIGMANKPDFRMTRAMKALVELWTEADEAYYRSDMKDGPTFPVRGFLEHEETAGELNVEVHWESEEIWPEVEAIMKTLLEDGFSVMEQKPIMWVTVFSMKDYWRAVRRIRELAKRQGVMQYLPLYASDMREIVEWMARTLFVTAWADREEERGRTYPGRKLFDVAPQTPKKARIAAWDLVKATEQANKMSFFEIYDQALQRAHLENTPKNREEFGYLLAMEALGHGVGLADEFPDHGIEVPDVEFRL